MKATSIKLMFGLGLTLAAVACSNTKTISMDKPLSASGDSSSKNRALSVTGNFADILCANPIAINDDSLAPITDTNSLPKGKYVMSSMQMYAIDNSGNDSFIASATSEDNFQAHVDCNGVVTKANFSSSYEANESLDSINMTKSDQSRVLKVNFEDGKFVAAHVTEIPSRLNGDDLRFDDTIPLGRVQIGPSFVTTRLYAPSTNTLELRLKSESKEDSQGKRLIQYIKIIYTRS